MLRILPLASRLSAPERVHGAIAAISQNLEQRAIPHLLLALEPGALPPLGPRNEQPTALLVVTGGTEHVALAALDHAPGMPALLLAHPDQNSFPAALEILARIRHLGRAGRIFLLNDQGDGYEALSRVAGYLDVRDRLHAVRLGRLGAPSEWLVASTPDAALVGQVWGPQVIDVPMGEVRAALDTVDFTEVDPVREDFLGKAQRVDEPGPEDVDRAAGVAVALGRVVRDHRLDACALGCFDLVVDYRTTGCLAVSALLDQDIVAGCEGDLPATLTMVWIQAMTGQVSFMANPQDLDTKTRTLWLAHCTIARRMVSRYALRSHFESSIGVGIQGHMEPGPVTIARIGGADLGELFVADGMVVAGVEHPQRCRTQVQVVLDGDVGALLDSPLGNHHVLVRGHWAAWLREYHDLFVRGSGRRQSARF
jgi:L-fucose isomerase-like protein